MNKYTAILALLTIIIVFSSTGCDVYQDLYGEEDTTTLENVSEEVDKTLIEILPQEPEEKAEEEMPFEEGDVAEIGGDIEVAEDEEEIGEEEIVVEEIEEPIVEVEETEEEVVEEEDEEEIEVIEVDVTEEEEEMPETEPISEAIVIDVEETEKISLVTEAEDPDDDILVFTYSSPLDENGEWETTYGDNGEYTVTITASDGELATSQDVLIIVKKKEEQPTIDSFSPSESMINIRETESIEFSVRASDLNDDELTYSWKLDGIEASDNDEYVYETGYEDSGSHTVKIDVSDGTSEVGALWSVTIENVNREPELEEIDTINVKETDTVRVSPVASDPDGDSLEFTISDPVGDDGVWKTTYDDSGEYFIVITVSDGEDQVEREVKIMIENVNRPPVIRGIVQK